jgi:hypothetical protein
VLGIFQRSNEYGAGMINFPIVFCLLYLFKNPAGENRPKMFYMVPVFLIIAAVTMVINSTVLSYAGVRYIIDFATFIILPSLFCAYSWSGGKSGILPYKARMQIIYALLAVSVFVGSLLFVTGATAYVQLRDPALFRYLEYSLGVIREF